MNQRFYFLFGVLLLALAATAQNSSSPPLKFGLFADVQYADCPAGNNRFYRETLQKLDTCIRCFNNENVQFAINLGDIIDRKNSDLDAVKPYLERLRSPLHHLTGNHDYKEVPDNATLYRLLGMPGAYYSFRKGNWVFVMLNTNDVAAYSRVAGTDKEQELTDMQNRIKQTGGTQGQRWNGGIGSRQLAWLDSLLARCARSKENVLVFSHHPFYPFSSFTALNTAEVLEVLTRYNCVKAVFSGHHHAGAFGNYKGIPLITHEGMVETERQNAYSIVEVTGDSIRITGYGRVPSRSIPLKQMVPTH